MEIICDSCGNEMKIIKSFGTKPRGENKKRYRVRRFYCDLCEISKTIFADGYKDENPQLFCKRLKSNQNE